MNNNGWIKYSEQKPACHGDYLVARGTCVNVFPYITQEDINEYMKVDDQIAELEKQRPDKYDSEKVEAYYNEQATLYDKLKDCYLDKFGSDVGTDMREPGFYDWMSGYDGDGSWVQDDVDYWMPIPKLPEK